MDGVACTWNDLESGMGELARHVLSDQAEFWIELASEQEDRDGELRELGMEGWLGASADAAQTIGEAGGVVGEALRVESSASCGRQVGLAGEERDAFPALDEGGDAVALDAVGELVVAEEALLAFGGIGETGRGAFEDESAEEAGEGTIESDAPAH